MANDRKMEIDLDLNDKQFNKAMQKALGSFNKLNDGVNNYDKSIKKASGGTKSILSSIDSFSIKLAGLSAGFSVFSSILSGVVDGLKQTVGSVLNVSGRLEQSEVSWKVFLGSAMDAKYRLKELYDFTAKTPFRFEQVDQLARGLQTVGRYSKENMALLGDIASATAKPLQQVLNAYQKLASGETGDALRMFRDINISSMDWKEAGIRFSSGNQALGTTEELIKALNKIAQNKNFSGLMAEQAMTLNGVISTLNDTWELFLKKIGDAGSFDYVKQNLINLRTLIEENEEGINSLAKLFNLSAMIIFKTGEYGGKGFKLLSDELIGAVKSFDNILDAYSAISDGDKRRLANSIEATNQYKYENKELDRKIAILKQEIALIKSKNSEQVKSKELDLGSKELEQATNELREFYNSRIKYLTALDTFNAEYFNAQRGLYRLEAEALKLSTDETEKYVNTKLEKLFKRIDERRQKSEEITVTAGTKDNKELDAGISRLTTFSDGLDSILGKTENISVQMGQALGNGLNSGINSFSNNFAEMVWGAEVTWKNFAKNIGISLTAEFTKVLASKAFQTLLNPQVGVGGQGGGFNLFGSIIGGITGFLGSGGNPVGAIAGAVGGSGAIQTQSLSAPRIQQKQQVQPIIIGGTITADSRIIAVALHEEDTRYNNKLGTLEVANG